MAIKRTEQEKSFQFVQGTRILGRKRVVNSENTLYSPGFFSPASIVQKRRTRRTQNQMERINALESLPKDMLIKVLCKVDHSDLRQLILVSKTVSAATLVARQIHHLYSTPVKKRLGKLKNYENTPSAPKQNRVARSRIEGKNLTSIAVVLFANDED